MDDKTSHKDNLKINTFENFINKVDYSFMDSLIVDPESTHNGNDFISRQVFSGHYVIVKPTPLSSPEYVSHSKKLFSELGLSDLLLKDKDFQNLFSGNLSTLKMPMRNFGWATGYALSIYGKEYIQQCPFKTGNGYGDGRAISVFEGIFKGKRFEMQLKGSGPTPYCRGGDGKAVLRSSIREFLAQELMHSLGIPTTRSLTLYLSKTDKVLRPWYKDNSQEIEPDVLIENKTAISTRVAPSFLRIGQLELFARRVKNNSHIKALKELKMIINRLIIVNYKSEIDTNLPFKEQIIKLAFLYRERLISLVVNWIRVGYCQGNFNSDNCALGGYTLDYGPFGFCELFDPNFQPWTGGGTHFSFFNQPNAAEINFKMFINSLKLVLENDKNSSELLENIQYDFNNSMQNKIEIMWTKKLGLKEYDESLINNLFKLMILTKVDYTKFFRLLSDIPKDITNIKKSFYKECSLEIETLWNNWLDIWHKSLKKENDINKISSEMKKVNPRYTWREWLISYAYNAAEKGDFSLINELQVVFNNPYEDLTIEYQNKFDLLRPSEFFNKGGISHYSCSS
tara:strand:- start:1408 stop:3111 length:1704 start_codon:yes stop_codon:yes gene_type:complete